MDSQTTTVGRFAPSPSGRMHVGNVFSLLIAWLAAKSQDGRIILRIEDLDPRSSKRDLALQLIEDIEWLGLAWDEGPYWQSERIGVYQEALATLREKGLIYPCFCTRQELHAASAPHASDGTYVYPGTCRGLSAKEAASRAAVRDPALRLIVPDERFTFEDAAFGPQEENLAHDVGDFLVRRSDGVFAYQLAVAVDDSLMGVTQVVRGRDLLGSSARQMYIQRELGLPSPGFGHIPLLVAPDGRRLSKRYRDLDLGALREQGCTPQQVIGALAALVGLAEKGEKPTLDQLLERFSWDALSAHRADIVVDSGFLD